jgi:hypothetical protein
LLERVTDNTAISRVICEHAFTPLSDIGMKVDSFGIETTEGHRIAQVIEKEPGVLRNLIEGDRLNA